MGRALGSVIQRMCNVVSLREAVELSDVDLVRRFAAKGDAPAFEAIVRRHGPMVLGVCRRLLNNSADADDAFQATFAILVRKARSLSRPEQLAGWLFQVAYRTARRARANKLKRQAHQVPLPEIAVETPIAEIVWRELRPIFDEELTRLPEKLRLPVVLCFLEGQSKRSAARALGWAEGTFSCRLQEARELLRSRLSRRGVTLSTAAMSAALFEGTASALVPPVLLSATIESASFIAAGATLSGPVALLTQGVIHSMFLTKVKIVAVCFLAVGVLGGGTNWVLHDGSGGDAVWAGPNGKESAGDKTPAKVEDLAKLEMDAELLNKLREDKTIELKEIEANLKLLKWFGVSKADARGAQQAQLKLELSEIETRLTQVQSRIKLSRQQAKLDEERAQTENKKSLEKQQVDAALKWFAQGVMNEKADAANKEILQLRGEIAELKRQLEKTRRAAIIADEVSQVERQNSIQHMQQRNALAQARLQCNDAASVLEKKEKEFADLNRLLPAGHPSIEQAHRDLKKVREEYDLLKAKLESIETKSHRDEQEAKTADREALVYYARNVQIEARTLPAPSDIKTQLMMTHHTPGVAEALQNRLTELFKPSDILQTRSIGTDRIVVWARYDDQIRIAEYIVSALNKKAQEPAPTQKATGVSLAEFEAKAALMLQIQNFDPATQAQIIQQFDESANAKREVPKLADKQSDGAGAKEVSSKRMLKYVDARHTVELLKQMTFGPGLRISCDERLNVLFLSGPQEAITKVNKVLDIIDKNDGSPGPIVADAPLMQTYQVQPGAAEALSKKLIDMFKPRENLRIWAISQNQIMVWAGPEDQKRIAEYCLASQKAPEDEPSLRRLRDLTFVEGEVRKREAEFEVADVNLKSKTLDVDRFTALANQGFVPAATIEKAKGELQRAQAEMKLAKVNLELAQAALDHARNTGQEKSTPQSVTPTTAKEWSLRELEDKVQWLTRMQKKGYIAQAEVDRARVDLARSKIVTELNNLVELRQELVDQAKQAFAAKSITQRELDQAVADLEDAKKRLKEWK